jgi:PiT family inorganic phosphate transporter
VGFGIYRLRPLHAFDSQLAAATVISTAAAIGGPVSTTHVVSSTIMGIGAAERPRAVRWGKASEILFTWFVTLPAAALLAAVCFMLVARFVL